MSKQRRFTAEEMRLIRDLAPRMTASMIAGQMGVNAPAVWMWGQRNGIEFASCAGKHNYPARRKKAVRSEPRIDPRAERMMQLAATAQGRS